MAGWFYYQLIACVFVLLQITMRSQSSGMDGVRKGQGPRKLAGDEDYNSVIASSV